MKKYILFVLLIAILLSAGFYIYFRFFLNLSSSGEQLTKFLNDKYYCVKDADCVIYCGNSVNRYWYEKNPHDPRMQCPAVVVLGTECIKHKCEPIY